MSNVLWVINYEQYYRREIERDTVRLSLTKRVFLYFFIMFVKFSVCPINKDIKQPVFQYTMAICKWLKTKTLMRSTVLQHDAVVLQPAAFEVNY